MPIKPPIAADESSPTSEYIAQMRSAPKPMPIMKGKKNATPSIRGLNKYFRGIMA